MQHLTKMTLALICALSLCYAAGTNTISGTVKKPGGDALANAVVRLLVNDMVDTTDANGEKSFIKIDDNLCVGIHKITAKDTNIVMSGCGVEFRGDSMSIKVWDPYGDNADCMECVEGDKSDAMFSIKRD